MGKKFVTAVNCMDGRVQEPVINFLKKRYKADYVDMITEPGPNKILCDNMEANIINSIKNRIDISIDMHESNLIAVVGHYDCAGNPVSKEEQIHHINIAIINIKSWYKDMKLVGLWVNKKWQVELVCEV